MTERDTGWPSKGVRCVPCVLIAALLVLACGGSERAAKDSGPPGGPNDDASPADTGFATDSAGDHVMLARAMTSRWTTRELRHTPRYLQLVGWRSRDTLVARAGDNPVEIDVRTSAFTAWNRQASRGTRRGPWRPGFREVCREARRSGSTPRGYCSQ